MSIALAKYAVIAAVDAERGFAKDGQIPWHYKEDFDWFKRHTMGKVCVMGRGTYEDINARLGEKAKDSVLPGRKCFVVSSTTTSLPNATVVKSVREVESHLTVEELEQPIFIIGGERLFREGVGMADVVYLTVINKTHGCDKYFPVEFVTRNFPRVRTFTSDGTPDLRFLVYTKQ